MNKFAPYILFPILFISFLSCSKKKDIKSTKIIGDQNLKILLSDPVETLDPLNILYGSDWKVASNIFEGLVSLDTNNQIVYQLIDSLNISEDKKEYSFFLKSNIYFHDNPCFEAGRGRNLNSYDIEYMFRRLANPENNFANYKILENSIKGVEEFNSGKSNSIDGIQIKDSLRFNISLIKPNSSFMLYLTSPNFFILPREAVMYYQDNINLNPVGTGPFRMSEYHKYRRILLVKNENYHKFDDEGCRLPYLNSIEYKTIKDTENRFTELVKNNAQFINANFNEYSVIKENMSILDMFNIIRIDKGSGIRYWGFYFDNNNGDTEYKKLRKKIALSFDRKFIENSDKGFTLAHSLIPSSHLKDIKRKWLSKFDPISADSISLADIQDTVIIMSNLVYPDMLELEKTLTSLRIPVKRIIQKVGYYTSISKVKPTLFRVSMIPSYPDPMEYYSLFYSHNSPQINMGNFSNSEYDRIYEYLLSETGYREKIESYNKLENILEAEFAAIYLSHISESNFIYSKKLMDVTFNYILPDFTNSYFLYNEE